MDGVLTANESLMVSGGAAADNLEALADAKTRIIGKELRHLANNVVQVIWGEFRAYAPESDNAWVTVRAVDSSWYEVMSDDPAVLKKLRSVFDKA